MNYRWVNETKGEKIGGALMVLNKHEKLDDGDLISAVREEKELQHKFEGALLIAQEMDDSDEIAETVKILRGKVEKAKKKKLALREKMAIARAINKKIEQAVDVQFVPYARELTWYEPPTPVTRRPMAHGGLGCPYRADGWRRTCPEGCGAF